MSHADEELLKSFDEISTLNGKAGKTVKIRGWVYRQRIIGDKAFVLIRDGTGIVQCVIEKNGVKEKDYKDASDVFIESVVTASGTVEKDERAPGGIEIKTNAFSLVFKGEPFPITKDQSTEFLLDIRHLWVRSQHIVNALKVKHYLMKYCREFLDAQGFIEMQPPLITGSACEGGSTLFKVDYFGKEAYLSQSGQLYSEALIAGYPKIYIFDPSFRAEPSRTPRHLTEFWQLEPEMAFYNQEMNMKLQEELVVYFTHKLAEEHADLLKSFGRNPEDLLKIKAPFKRMKYEQAIKTLNDKGMKVGWLDGLGYDEEKALMKDTEQPIFVTNQPKEIRAFYMKEDPGDTKTVLDADLLAPEGIGEIIGGSERISDYNELVARLKEQKLPVEQYKWYLDLRKYGTVPHSGFGMGSERVVRWLCKLESIRDAIPFPRNINRLYP